MFVLLLQIQRLYQPYYTSLLHDISVNIFVESGLPMFIDKMHEKIRAILYLKITSVLPSAYVVSPGGQPSVEDNLQRKTTLGWRTTFS